MNKTPRFTVAVHRSKNHKFRGMGGDGGGGRKGGQEEGGGGWGGCGKACKHFKKRSLKIKDLLFYYAVTGKLRVRVEGAAVKSVTDAEC